MAKLSEIEKSVAKQIFNKAKEGETNQIVLELILGIEQKVLSDVKRPKKEKQTTGKGQPAKSAS